jgi:adenine-specific DNA methylase
MDTFGDLFTPRQALALATLSGLVGQVGQQMQAEGQPPDFIEAVQTCLALAVDRLADRSSSLCTWRPQADQEKIEHVFARQALPMTWDFAEGTFLSAGTAGWTDAFTPIARLIDEHSNYSLTSGQAVQASATDHRLSDDSIQVYATDPPYYNAVPYADLSDFFYVWLNRTVRSVHPSLFSEALSPKSDELCEMSGWDPERYAHKDSEWYRIRMGQAMAEGRRVLAPDGIGVVVFAHKGTAGWEAQLQAMLEAGWIITASWPIDTEMGTRLRAQDSAALASSIHLVCRPREDASGQLSTEVGDWREVLAELPRRMAAWLPRLARENVVGADAIFACLGPAMEIYSRYARVEKANGEQVFLREYLEEVWAAISRQALSIVFEGADTSGFEEDARLTAMWLWTLQREANLEAEASQDEADEADEGSAGQASRGGYELEYDAARKIAQGLGARLEKLGHLVRIKGSTAALLRMSERAEYLFGGALRPTTTARAPRPRQRNLFELVDQAEAQDFAALHEAGDALQAALGGGRTTLDRVHQAALLHATARTEALRRFLVEDGVGREGRFWRLADALLRLYPPTSEERRWLEGLLARKKVLGL